MSNYYRHFCLIVLIVFVFACKSKTTEVSVNIPVDNDLFIGHYADDGYAKRNEGWDWVGIIISQGQDSAYHIAVRSRADRKKATCFFDAEAGPINANTLRAEINGIGLLFILNDSLLQVKTEKEEDASALNYYCSGGASFAGNYTKQINSLSASQVDNRIFAKFLSLQNNSFDVVTQPKDSMVYLTVTPYGLSKDTSRFSIALKEKYVIDAEIEDMNSDGYPELLIYTRSNSADKNGDVIGFSVNKGKSMSIISLPDIHDDLEASKGYQGRDKFAIVENILQRRFQVTDKDGQIKLRWLSYKMIKGEAGYKWDLVSMREE